MIEKKNRQIADETLETVVGGIIGHTLYKCPICGAEEVKDIDTDSHGGYPRGGDGWCDQCGVAMTKVKSWI